MIALFAGLVVGKRFGIEDRKITALQNLFLIFLVFSLGVEIALSGIRIEEILPQAIVFGSLTAIGSAIIAKIIIR